MSWEQIRENLAAVERIIDGWGSETAVSELEKDIALEKLRRIYETIKVAGCGKQPKGDPTEPEERSNEAQPEPGCGKAPDSGRGKAEISADDLLAEINETVEVSDDNDNTAADTVRRRIDRKALLSLYDDDCTPAMHGKTAGSGDETPHGRGGEIKPPPSTAGNIPKESFMPAHDEWKYGSANGNAVSPEQRRGAGSDEDYATGGMSKGGAGGKDAYRASKGGAGRAAVDDYGMQNHGTGGADEDTMNESVMNEGGTETGPTNDKYSGGTTCEKFNADACEESAHVTHGEPRQTAHGSSQAGHDGPGAVRHKESHQTDHKEPLPSAGREESRPAAHTTAGREESRPADHEESGPDGRVGSRPASREKSHGTADREESSPAAHTTTGREESRPADHEESGPDGRVESSPAAHATADREASHPAPHAKAGLRAVITPNDRFLMMRDMFGSDPDAYERTIDRFDSFTDLGDAVVCMYENFSWNPDDEGVRRFVEILESKLS